VWQGIGTGEVPTGFWWGNLRERDQMEDVDGMIILKRIFEKCDGQDMDCIALVQDREPWRALVNVVMDIPYL
jgi:hypothetical protein